MTWKLAHNLEVRVAAVKSCYPHLTIGEVGDLAHQSEASDHNPDSRGVVHAVDFMAAAGTAEAKAILGWLLADPADLQYVIHNREIYTRAADFKPAPYHGTDPHTNHIHVSGKHGTVGRNAATGTGYDTAAEAMTPAGTPCTPQGDDMPLTDADIAKIWAYDGIPNWRSDAKANPTLQARNALGYLGSALSPLTAAAIAAAVLKALPPAATGGITPAQMESAVTEALSGLSLVTTVQPPS